MNKRVMVHAYTKYNLGDDLFIKVLCERYPDTTFYLPAPNEYKKLFKNISNLIIVPNDGVFLKITRYIMRKLKFSHLLPLPKQLAQCDAVINIGGSIFIQDENWKEQIKINKQKKLVDKPFFLLGANFGPYKEKEFHEEYKNIFESYTDVCLRDSYSYELFSDLTNVRLADDIVFQLNTKEVNSKSEKTVVISVIKPSMKKQEKQLDEVYYKKITEIVRYLNEKKYFVTLMSFCEKEGDMIAVKNIMNLLPKENLAKVNYFSYKYNIEKALELIGNSELVIATRFHAMILGWLFHKPVFPITYSEKMTNVMNDIDFQGTSSSLLNINMINPEEIDKCFEDKKMNVYKQKVNAEGHFLKLDYFLKS